MGAEHPNAVLDHDLSWMLDAQCGDRCRPSVFIRHEGETLVGYAPFLVRSSAIGFQFGEMRLGSYCVREWAITGGPLISAGDSSRAQRALLNLFGMLRRSVDSGDVVFIQGAACDGPLVRMLTSSGELKALFHVLPDGPPYQRCLIELPSTFEEYLDQLGAGTRSDLRRHERKLKTHVGGQVFTRCYTDPETVSEFIDHAEAISQRTYQWHLLGRGLRDRQSFQRRLCEASRRGWMRCYILFCGGQPVAFMVGYLHRRRYYSTDIGFDPEWRKWSVGNVLHCEVMRDLIAQSDRVRFFDFLGGTLNHVRLSNRVAAEEANFYLIPTTLEGLVLTSALRFTASASAFAGRALERMNLKESVRKLIRQRSVQAAR